MNANIANVVYPVFAYGIRLKERLAGGEVPEIQSTQAELHGMLKDCKKLDRWAAANPARSMGGSTAGRPSNDFLGMHYALVCWLDEIFIADSPDSQWRKDWTNKILEYQLYETRDRAWNFWQQWKKAETQSATDPLEVYHLCAVLGFRGELKDSPDQLRERLDSAVKHIASSEEAEWKGPVDSPPQFDAPQLYGAARLRRMVKIVGVSLLVLIPLAAFYLITKLRH